MIWTSSWSFSNFNGKKKEQRLLIEKKGAYVQYYDITLYGQYKQDFAIHRHVFSQIFTSVFSKMFWYAEKLKDDDRLKTHSKVL
jgi:hypothetical protein